MKRHTWQSWRERYKKNSDRLDKHIQAIVELTKPSQGGQGQYGYVRQVEKVKRVRKKRAVKRQGSAEAETSAIYNEEPTNDLGVIDTADYVPVPEPNLLIQNDPLPVPVRRSPAEEEMDDTEDDPEWAIRIGNAPPPAWAKRKASAEHPDASPSKRPRQMYVYLLLPDTLLTTISPGIPKCILSTEAFSRLPMISGSR